MPGYKEKETASVQRKTVIISLDAISPSIYKYCSDDRIEAFIIEAVNERIKMMESRSD